MAVRYNVEDARDSGELVGQTLDGGGIGVPSGGRDLFIRDQSLVATWIPYCRPIWSTPFLAQYARRHYNFPGMTGQPDFSILNDLEFGHNFGTNDRLYETRVRSWRFAFVGQGQSHREVRVRRQLYLEPENFPGFMPVRMLVPGVMPCLVAISRSFTIGPLGDAIANLPTSAALDAVAAACPVPRTTALFSPMRASELPASPAFHCRTAARLLASSARPLNTTTWANAYPPSLFNTFSKEIDHGYWGLFAQDQWRLNPKLTLNLGLRWDYESGLAAFVEPDYAAGSLELASPSPRTARP